jgi:hypothetical protein
VTPLLERGEVIDLVGRALRRTGVPERPFRITLLAGPRGAGGTAVIEALWDTHAVDHLAARLDLRTADRVNDVLFAAMRGLRRPVTGVSSVSFPRLGLGFKALTFSEERASFDAHMQKRLNEPAREALDNIDQIAQTLLVLADPSQRAAAAAHMLAQAIPWAVEKFGGHRDQDALAWYGADGMTALWELCRDHRDGAEHSVSKKLCAAFLADLAVGFNEPKGLRRRHRNALLLLDNANDKTGRELLRLLTECRQESAGGADPLVVVAAWRGRPSPRLGSAVQLTDLTKGAIVDLAGSNGLGGSDHNAEFLRAITGGNPAAVRLITELMPSYDGRDLLSQALPEGETVLDWLIKRVLAGDLGELDPAAVCAATSGVRELAAQKVFQSLRWTDEQASDVRAALENAMWLHTDDKGTRLHPLPSIVLRRWLARDAVLWRRVHEAYAAHYGSARDEALRHFHGLALTERDDAGPLRQCVTFLCRTFNGSSAAQWLEVMDTVTAAPTRVDSVDEPRALVTRLAGRDDAADEERTIARLTASLWLYGDPTVDPRHRLAGLIAGCLERLAATRETDDDAEVLYARARSYRQIAWEWERLP